jgi:hypothetical protein
LEAQEALKQAEAVEGDQNDQPLIRAFNRRFIKRDQAKKDWKAHPRSSGHPLKPVQPAVRPARRRRLHDLFPESKLLLDLMKHHAMPCCVWEPSRIEKNQRNQEKIEGRKWVRMQGIRTRGWRKKTKSLFFTRTWRFEFQNDKMPIKSMTPASTLHSRRRDPHVRTQNPRLISKLRPASVRKMMISGEERLRHHDKIFVPQNLCREKRQK